jgi:protein-L-isoaspartate O-methyltransferase
MMTRPRSYLCIALLVAACDQQAPARSANQAPAPEADSSTALTSGSSTELTPASRSLEQPAANSAPAPAPVPAPNALGVPATPPAAAAGPTGSEPAPAQPTRTPDVVYVPTPQPVVDRMLQMAQVKKGDVVYDLGCGDGRIVITAAKKFGVRAYGFDIDPDRVAEAKANVKAAKLENLVTIEQKDIFTLDLSPASVVTLYLLPKLNVRLIPQLEQLEPGSRVVSHDFAMEGIKPVQQVSMRVTGEAENHNIYLWKLPFVRE